MAQPPHSSNEPQPHDPGVQPSSVSDDQEEIAPTQPRGGGRRTDPSPEQRDRTEAARVGDVEAPDTSELPPIALAHSEAVPLKPTLSRYALGNELGKGGMGLVRLAADPALRRAVAIKLLLEPGEGEARREFLDEAQITGQLEHPNIVPVHELGTDEQGRPFLAMKRVSGMTLKDVVEARREQTPLWPSDAPELLDIFGKVCDAIAYAHARGVIHRDLKPENIMVGEFGEVLVMDWGLAKPLAHLDGDTDGTVTTPRREAQPTLTMQGEVMGTPAYMSPEQAHGEVELVDERSDIFGLGAILYALLTLEPPYTGRSVDEVLERAAARDLVPPRQRSPKRRIPAELEAIVLKAMHTDPQRRYRLVSELKRDVQAHLASLPTLARRDPPWVRLTKWSKRHPLATMSTTLSVMFGLVLAVLALQLEASNQQSRVVAAERDRFEVERALAQAQARESEERAAREAAERDAAQARAMEAEQRAAREAAEREAAQARAMEAEHLLSTRVRQMLSHQVQDSINEFHSLRDEAAEAGISDARFAASLSEEQLREFLRAYDALIAVHKDIGVEPNALHWFNRGMLRRFSGDFEGAEADYTEALRLNPDDVITYGNRGNVRRMSGNLEAAIEDYNRALELDPDDATTYNNRGVAFFHMGKFERAIADYERAIELDKQYLIAYSNRGNARYRLDRYEEAIADFDYVIERMPTYAEAYSNRGNVRGALGDIEGQLEDYNRAIELNPHYRAALLNRATLHQREGNLATAIEDLDRVIEIESDARSHRQRGNAKRRMQDYQGAIEDYSWVIERGTEDPNVYYHRGLCHFLSSNYEAAEVDFSRCIELSPEDALAYTHRGACRAELGDLAGALADQDRAVELAPGHAAIRFNRGTLRISTDDYEGAVADFTASLEIRPNRPSVYGNRGLAYYYLGEHDRAIADFERAIELRPGFWRFWMNLGLAQIANGNRDDGVESLRRSYGYAPSAAVREYLAKVFEHHEIEIPD